MTRLNKILLSMLFVAMVFVIGNMEVQANCNSCDSSYNDYTFPMTIGGCNYEVTVCAQCFHSWPGDFYINCITKMAPVECDPVGIDEADVPQQAYIQLSTNYTYFYEACGYQAPPCSTGQYSDMTLYTNTCWYMVWEDNTVKYKPCDNNEACEVLYEYCVKSNGEIQVIKTPSHFIDPCNLPCNEEAANVKVPTAIKPAPTPCYIQYTDCIPGPCYP